jgi:hypothetical protein
MSQLIEQRIGLGFRQRKSLEEAQHLTRLVQRHPDHINLISQRDQNLHPEFTTPGHTDWPAEVIAPTIDFVRDQNGAAVFQTPRDSGVRKIAVVGRTIIGIDLFRPRRFGDLLGCRDSSLAFRLVLWLSLSLRLAIRFGPLGIGIAEPFCRILPDPRLQLSDLCLFPGNAFLLRSDQVDQPIEFHRPLGDILSERLQIHPAVVTNFEISSSANFTQSTPTFSA